MAIRLLTLGGLRAFAGNAELDWLPAQRMRAALLVYLGVDRRVARDALTAVIWPDTTDEKARHALSQSLYSLRRSLGGDWLEANALEIRVTSALECDARMFEEALEKGSFQAAARLYSGPFLQGVHLLDLNPWEHWVDTRRAQLARGFRRACREWVNERAAQHDLDGALEAARSWVAPDPFDDEAHHRLIELLAERGERAEALRHYEGLERLLEREELQPIDETKRLVERIRTGPAAVSAGSMVPSPRPVSPPVLEAGKLDSRLAVELSPEFEILREIGRGSMARVFLARDHGLQRLVAIKVLRPELALEPRARVRFEREARAAAKLRHPNVVSIHRVGTLSDGTPYLIMEYVEGRNLTDTLAAEGALSDAEACAVLGQLAAALATAHAHGIIHRDVRPPNIVWTRESGLTVLMDFGFAAVAESASQAMVRLTQSGEILGDMAYMSPEQLLDEPLTGAADIFSLGVVGYEILTLGRPYRAASRRELAEAQMSRLPEPLASLRPGTTPALADLLQRCLAKKPEHRPSALMLTRAFDDLANARAPQRFHTTDPAEPAVTEEVRTALEAFLDEIKQRRVVNIALAYAGAAFIILQGGDLILRELPLPAWSFTLLVALVLSGFPVALVLAWMFDVTKTGIRRAEAPRARALRAFQLAGLGLSLLLAVLIGWWILAS